MTSKSTIYRFGGYEAHEREFSLVKAGETVAVEPKAFRVLLILLRNPKKLIPKEELLNAVWGDAAVTENSLTRAIALLRRLLGDDAREPKFIETVTSVGYRWLCPVERIEDPTTVAAPGEPPEATPAASPAASRTGRRNRWIRIAAPAFAALILLAAGFWYLTHPLPPPRITAYTQITHDGRSKEVGGTDGSRVYFTQNSPTLIAQIGVNGGDIARIPVAIPGNQILLMDVSPDGSNILVAAAEENNAAAGLWIGSVFGGSMRRFGAGYGAAFSPGGASIVFSTSDGDIDSIQVNGSGLTKLTSAGRWPFQIRFSPDGKRIRFQVNGVLYEMRADGTGLHPLLPGWGGIWTADGKFFLFGAGNSAQGDQIWALDERGGLLRHPPRTPIQLTTGPIHWGRPFPSRDGAKIFADGETPRGELTRFNIRTGQSEPYLGGISAEFVSFSKDGKSIAYVSYPEDILWKANRDGSNPVRLTDPSLSVINPRWSPDGKEILFADANTLAAGTYLVHSGGGAPTRILQSEPKASDPNWSPDGKQILFSGGEARSREHEDLRIVDLASGKVTAVPGSTGFYSPRWSADGRYIAALAWDAPRLRVFDTKGQKWIPCAGVGEGVNFPTFSADGKSVFFLRYGRDQGVFRISVAGGKVERVADMTDWHLTGYFGYSMSLDPTDAPLVLRDTGTDDIYALTLEVK